MSGFFTGAISTNVSQSQINSVGGNQCYTYVNYSAEQEKILAALKPVDRGEFVPRCMEGTRMDIFKKVDDWLGCTDAPNILWISGSPGAGKSAIASSLISKLAKQRRLGASDTRSRSSQTSGLTPASRTGQRGRRRL